MTWKDTGLCVYLRWV